MNPNADHIKHLSPKWRERLEQFLTKFVKTWSPTAMTEIMANSEELPADHPLRYPLLIEISKLDLNRRWATGQRIMLEEYLAAYPELGSVHTVSVDLLRAEYKARKAHGDRVEIGEYARRFPNQYPAFHQRSVKAPPGEAVPDLADLKKPSETPAAPRITPVKARSVPAHPQAASRSTEAAPKRRPWALVVVALLLLLCAIVGWMGYQARYPQIAASNVGTPQPDATAVSPPPPGTASPQKPGAPLSNTTALESLTVKLDLGAGEDLQEAISLDLGLGFPLWLVPGGAQPHSLPFGAVPQKTTASGKVPSGGSATFTFLTGGESGQDLLSTTPRLLSGLKVGDIRRIGFGGLAPHDWQLAAYEIQINGKTLHSASGLKIRPKQLQDEAMKKLAALNQAGAPADQERSDLRDLVQAGLASETEKARLAELEKQTAGPSAEDRLVLERQLHGQSPWYVEKVPTRSARSPGRRRAGLFDLDFNIFPRAYAAAVPAASPPRLVRITVVTDATFDQSDTRSLVYFMAGGRKYLIGSPEAPLSSINGPQIFVLDLLAGPLDSTDLRDFGLGMLAPPTPLGKGPDRWHPLRLQVEVDGTILYDSENNPSDLQTLAAIRLVPPTQLDLDGVTVVKNPTHSRELYVWLAGKASGFDPVTGALNPLPSEMLTANGELWGGRPAPGGGAASAIGPIDPNAPIAQSTPILLSTLRGPVDPNSFGGAHQPFGPPQITFNIGNQQFPPALSPGGGFTKSGFSGGGFPGGGFPGGFPGEAPRLNFANPFVPQNPAQPLVNLVLGALGLPLALPLPSTKPVNNAKAPQIESVEFVQLDKGPLMRIAWKISDETGVERYDISLQGMEDDLSIFAQTPRGGQPSTSLQLSPPPPLGIPRGINSITVPTPVQFLLDYRFVRPVVKPVPLDKSISAMTKFGPVRSTAPLQKNFINSTFTGVKQLQVPPLAFTVPIPSGFRIHTGFDAFDPNGPLVVPLDGKSEVNLSLTCNDLPVGAAPKTIRIYTGFSGGDASGSMGAAGNKVEYRVKAFANHAPTPPGGVTTTIALNNVTVPGKSANPISGFFTMDGSEHKMDVISIDLSPLTTPSAKTKQWTIQLTLSMRKFSGDTSRSPVVFDTVILQ